MLVSIVKDPIHGSWRRGTASGVLDGIEQGMACIA
jgi:hypothetical protein